jgi:hypothetical protein
VRVIESPLLRLLRVCRCSQPEREGWMAIFRHSVKGKIVSARPFTIRSSGERLTEVDATMTDRQRQAGGIESPTFVDLLFSVE